MNESSIMFNLLSNFNENTLNIDDNEYIRVSYGDTGFNGSTGNYWSEKNDITIVPADSGFNEYIELFKIQFSNSITYIGSNAFIENTKLNDITILNSVTSIGTNAFANVNHEVTTTIDSPAYKWFCDNLDITKNKFTFLFLDKDYVVRCTDITSENSNTEEYASYFDIKANQIPSNAVKNILTFVLNFDNGNVFEFVCQAIHTSDNDFTVEFYYSNSSIPGFTFIYASPPNYSNFYYVMLETLKALNDNVVLPYLDSIVDGKCY